MNYKNKLKELRDIIFGVGSAEENSVQNDDKNITSQYVEPIKLSDLIDKFIEWHRSTMLNWYSSSFINNYSDDIRNLIEKMAVWYELRYPDYEVSRVFFNDSEDKKVDNIMFKLNPYLSNNQELNDLSWYEFYNANVFFRSLPSNEKQIFLKPNYSQLVYIDSSRYFAHLHLSKKGIVEEAEGFGIYTNFCISDNDLIGWQLEDVVRALKENNIYLPKGNELEQELQSIENWKYQKEELLNCVMYRIIERSHNKIGACRALLFAKEFKRCPDIPMMYGVDYNFDNLRTFVNEYLKLGGSSDLLCYINPFLRTHQDNKVKAVPVSEILKESSYSEKSKYTPEEVELQQKLVSILNNQIDSDLLEKEKVKQLRIERKLTNSRKKESE